MGGRGGKSGLSNNGSRQNIFAPPSISLTGSPKQVEWANDIISNAFSHLEETNKRFLESSKKNTDRDFRHGEELLAEGAAEYAKFLRKKISQTKDAKTIINNRENMERYRLDVSLNLYAHRRGGRVEIGHRNRIF